MTRPKTQDTAKQTRICKTDSGMKRPYTVMPLYLLSNLIPVGVCFARPSLFCNILRCRQAVPRYTRMRMKTAGKLIMHRKIAPCFVQTRAHRIEKQRLFAQLVAFLDVCDCAPTKQRRGFHATRCGWIRRWTLTGPLEPRLFPNLHGFAVILKYCSRWHVCYNTSGVNS